MPMKDKVVMLMGGRGERLWPLTEQRPKPNVYVGPTARMGKYTLDRMVNAGYYKNIVLAVNHMADEIHEKFGDGSHFLYDNDEARLNFTYSPVPGVDKSLATADALRKARIPLSDGVRIFDRTDQEEKIISAKEYIEDRSNEQKRYAFKGVVENYERVIVSSGDGIFNFDLKKIVEFHKSSGAFATIALYKMPHDRLDEIVDNFGLAEISEDRRLKAFIEKPKKKDDIKSDYVNTGIYVFDKSILDELESYDWMDFGKDVFPALLKMRGADFYGYLYDEPDGYWSDVGTLETYWNTSRQLRERIPGINTRSRKLFPEDDNEIFGTVSGKSLLGHGIRLAEGSSVSNSIIGNNVSIGRNVNLNDCIIFPGTTIESDFEGNGIILDTRVIIEPKATIGNGSVIGSGTKIKQGAEVAPNSLISADNRITGKVSGIVKRD